MFNLVNCCLTRLLLSDNQILNKYLWIDKSDFDRRSHSDTTTLQSDITRFYYETFDMNRGERRYLVLWSVRPPVNRLRVYSLCYKTAAKYRLWRDKDRTDGRAGSSSSQQCYQTLTPRLMYQPPHWQGNVRQINVWRYRVGGLNMSWSEERGVGRVWGGGGTGVSRLSSPSLSVYLLVASQLSLE